MSFCRSGRLRSAIPGRGVRSRPVAVRLPEESSDRIPDAGPNPGAGASPFRQRPQPLVAEPHVRRGRPKPPIASAKVLFFPSDLQKAGDKLVAAGRFSDFCYRCRYCRRCYCRCRCCCRSRRRSDCSGRPAPSRFGVPGRGVPGHARSERLSDEFPMSKGIPVAVGAGRGESQNRSCPTAARCGGFGRFGRTGGPVGYSAVAGRMTTFTRLASSRIFRAMRRTSLLPSARTAFS